MPSWLKGIVLALFAQLEKPLASLGGYLAGRARGRLEQQNKQDDQDDKTIKRGADARNKHRAGGLRGVAEKYHTDE